ncbi:MAG: hypothetical protein WBE14_06180, partial [Xanthobacteraceae bacterium]
LARTLKCDDPNGFSRSLQRPGLHYVVMSSPIPSKLQPPIVSALLMTRCYAGQMLRSDQQNLVSLLSVLQDLGELQRGMPVSFLKTLLLVGMDEGQTAAEYGRRAGVDRFQMSRYMRTLGPYNVKRRCDGFGWVEETTDKRHRNQRPFS